MGQEVVVKPSKVDGEVARLASDGERDWVEVWTSRGWERPRGSYPDVAALMKAPPAWRDDLIRVGVPGALPGDLAPPYPRVVIPPVVIDGQVYRLASTGIGCFVEWWDADDGEWNRLQRLEHPSAEEVVDAPAASHRQLRAAGLIRVI